MTAKTYDIETSLTLDYRKLMWGLERIVLDSVSNHLPDDSKGTKVSVLFKQNGEYIDFKEAKPDTPVEEVAFIDDGKGYDAKLLSVLFSTKTADAISVGQHGEGLKLVAAAALREGLEIEYNSRNWTAVPYKKHERIGGNDLERLCFRITENGNHLDGSQTVVRNPTPEFVKEVLLLPEKVLMLSQNYREVYKENPSPNPNIFGFGKIRFSILRDDPKPYASRIIELGNGSTDLFVKGVKIQKIDSIFSYDLGIDEITPDRYFANRNKMLEKIEDLLKTCTDTAVIEKILRTAELEPDRNYEEFAAFMTRVDVDPFLGARILEKELFNENSKMKGGKTQFLEDMFKGKFGENLWLTTFKKMYGENAILANQMDTNINKDAEIMGFRTVTLNNAVEGYLESLGVRRAREKDFQKDYRWVSPEDLTHSEREVLDFSKDINRMYGIKEIPIRIFSGVFFSTGRESESDLGVWIMGENGETYLGIRRDRLKDPLDFASTYIHEAGHNESRKPDYHRDFTEYFITHLAREAVKKFGAEKHIGGSGI